MLKRALTRTVAWTFSIPRYAQYIYPECDHQLSITYSQMFVLLFCDNYPLILQRKHAVDINTSIPVHYQLVKTAPVTPSL